MPLNVLWWLFFFVSRLIKAFSHLYLFCLLPLILQSLFDNWRVEETLRKVSERTNNLPHIVAVLSVMRESSIPILMTTVKAGGNVLLPYWSLIHYELLVDGRVKDGEWSIHHRLTPTLLGRRALLVVLSVILILLLSSCDPPFFFCPSNVYHASYCQVQLSSL